MSGQDASLAAGAEVPVLFQAVIVPQRSLSALGRQVLIGVILASSVINAGVFVAIGAWPVGVFTAVELALAGWLFHLHMRAARASELLILSQAGLRIVRTSPRGERHCLTLPADWLSVRLEERPGRVPGLLLQTRGTAEEVARDLGETAKRDLAEALREALHARRHPAFDNPQLG